MFIQKIVKFKKSILISLFVLIVIFIIIYINTSNHEDIQIKQDDLAKVKNVAKNIDIFFYDIKTTCQNLSKAYCNFYKNNVKQIYPESDYYRDKKNVLSDHDNNTGFALYVSANTKITKTLKKFITTSDHMKSLWAKVRKKYPFIGWQYITDAKTYAMRGYPWSDASRDYGGAYDIFTLDLVTKTFKNSCINDKTSKWIGPITDTAGFGVIMVISSPICLNKKLLGVQSIDIPFNNVLKKYLISDENNKNYDLFLVSHDYQIFSDVSTNEDYNNTYKNILFFKELIQQKRIDISKKESKIDTKNYKLIIISFYIKEINCYLLMLTCDNTNEKTIIF